MRTIWRAKFWLGTTLASLFVTLSYELKTTALAKYQWALVIFSFILATFLTETLVNLLLKFRTGRMVLMGKSWVEGHWYLHTYQDTQSPSIISNDGIVYISYEGSEFELNVITYRSRTSNLNTGFSSISRLATVRDFDANFTNYFRFPGGNNETHGITVGKFFSDGGSFFSNKFEGTVVLFSDGIYRRQLARRIHHSFVKRLESEHGENWRDFVLKHGYDYIDTATRANRHKRKANK